MSKRVCFVWNPKTIILGFAGLIALAVRPALSFVYFAAKPERGS